MVEVVVEGTLKPDGTLELDARPNLPPGRVTVIVRQQVEPASKAENWWQALQQIRADREASGYLFLNGDNLEKHLEWLREADQIDDLLGQADQQPPSRGPTSC